METRKWKEGGEEGAEQPPFRPCQRSRGAGASVCCLSASLSFLCLGRSDMSGSAPPGLAPEFHLTSPQQHNHFVSSQNPTSDTQALQSATSTPAGTMARASLPRKCKAGPSSSPSSSHRAANKGKRLATKKTKQAVRNPKPGIHTARGSRSSVRDRTATTPSPVPPVPAVPDVAREEAPDTVSSEAPWVMRRPAGTAVVHYGANGAGYELLYEWELLSGCIGYLIRHLLPEKMSWDTLDVETREKMLSWAPNAKCALESAWLSRCKHPSLLCSPRRPRLTHS